MDSIFAEISKVLLEGQSVKLHTFGSFLVRDKRERVGRNPRTGVRVAIEPRRVITFKASPQMRDAIALSYGDLSGAADQVATEVPADIQDLVVPGGKVRDNRPQARKAG